MDSAVRIAFKDISQYYEGNDIIKKISYGRHEYDTFYVSERYLRSKETTRLNRELGLNAVNMGRHNMTRIKKR